MSIRRRLSLLVVVLAVPAALLAGFLAYSGYRHERSAIELRLEDTARALALAVDRQLGQAEATARALASSPHLASGDWEAFDGQARALVANDKAWIVVWDETKQQLINTSRPRGTALPRAPGAMPLELLAEGKSRASDLIMPGAVVGRPVAGIAAPVMRDGQVKYAVAYTFLPSLLSDLLAQQEVPEGWIATVLDRKGVVVARTPDPGGAFVGRSATLDLLSRIERSDRDLFESVSLTGVPTLLAFSRSPNYGWTLSLAAPRSELTSRARETALYALGLGALLLVIGLAAAAVLTRGISRSINSLARAAADLGRGSEPKMLRTGIAEADEVAAAIVDAGQQLRLRSAERDANEAALRESEARFRRMADSAAAPVWVTMKDGGIGFVNKALADFAGMSPDQLLGNVWVSLVHADDIAAVAKRRAEAWANGHEPYVFEARFRRHDGAWRWLLASSNPRRNRDGEFQGYVGLALDVTDVRLAQEELRAINANLEERVAERTRELAAAMAKLGESERQFRLLVQGVADYAIFMLDVEGRVTSWNSGAERIKGYGSPEVLGSHFSRFYTDEDRQNGLPQRALETATREGRYEAEGWRVRKDGKRFWASAVIDRIRDESGRVVGFAKVTRDLSEKRQAEEQLRQAQKMEAIGQMTGGLAHDFNNLLTVVIGSVYRMQLAAEEPEKVRRLGASAQQAAERAGELTQKLLAFARRQTLHPTRTDPNRLIREFAPLIRQAAGGAVNVRFDLGSDVGECEIDEAQTQAAILNLVVNSRDAMPSAGGTITIATEAVEVGPGQFNDAEDLALGTYMRISVSDTGTGMSPDIRTRAFDPFFTTKGVGKGSGLGLSMVYGFAKQSGGHATIDTAEGDGTPVSLYLPRVDRESIPRRQVACSESAP